MTCVRLKEIKEVPFTLRDLQYQICLTSVTRAKLNEKMAFPA